MTCSLQASTNHSEREKKKNEHNISNYTKEKVLFLQPFQRSNPTVTSSESWRPLQVLTATRLPHQSHDHGVPYSALTAYIQIKALRINIVSVGLRRT